MTVTKDFKLKVFKGMRGLAIVEIQEILSKHSVYVGNDVHPALILLDIDDAGIEEWVQCNLTLLPEKLGFFEVYGEVSFTEDSVDYLMKYKEI